MYSKRGQVAVFIIIGIFILLIVGLFVFLFSSIQDPVDPIQDKLDEKKIRLMVEQCIEDVSVPIIGRMVHQGGTLSLSSYRMYDSNPYNLFCIYEQNKACVPVMITREKMQKELEEEIKPGVKSCINFDFLREQGYEVTESGLDVDIDVRNSDVEIILTYDPFKIVRGDFSFEKNRFEKNIKTNLGDFLDLATYITNSENADGYFIQEDWMKEHGAEILIRKNRPYPDVVYELESYNPQTLRIERFHFAIQGVDTVSKIEEPYEVRDFGGWCKLEDDSCIFNVDSSSCGQNGGVHFGSKPGGCREIPEKKDCPGGECKDCGTKLHGESWCLYDGSVFPGFALVGSRHYKQVCVNGRIITSDCRDYREEICSQTSGYPKKAVCRPNRWKSCSKQTTKSACENREARDCFWGDYLFKSSPFFCLSDDFSQRKCAPFVPPGFRHWEGDNGLVCSLANEQYNCDGASCPQRWVDSTYLYCISLGDCGEYNNFLGVKGNGGYENDDTDHEIDVGGYASTKSDYALTLGIDYWDFEKFYGDEFKFKSSTSGQIQKNIQRWQKSCSKPRIDDDEKLYYNVMHTALCNVWNAPKSGNCNECSLDPRKPCSEYRCLSIGRECVYREVKGEGVCGDRPEDTTSPLVEVSRVLELRDDAPISKIANTQDSSLLNEYVVRELSVKPAYDFGLPGFDVVQQVKPYHNYLVEISSDKNLRCKVSYSPNVGYDEIASVNGEYKNTFMYPFKILSIEGQREFFKQMGFGSSVDLVSMKGFRQQTYDLFCKGKFKFKQAEEFCSEGKLPPGLEEFFKSAINTLKQELQLVLVQLEMRKNIQFFFCEDFAGNQNKGMFVRFGVLEDKEAPIVLKTDPEDAGQGSYEPRLFVNEPADCRYGFSPSFEFISPAGYFDCESSPTEYNQDWHYECVSEIEGGKPIYVKCKDMPPLEYKYKVFFKKSDELKVLDSLNPSLVEIIDPNIVTVHSDFVISDASKVNTVIGYPESTQSGYLLNLVFSKNLKCRYSTESEGKFDMYSADYSMDCALNNVSNSVCSQRLNPVDDVTYYITCLSDTNLVQNTNKRLFKIGD